MVAKNWRLASNNKWVDNQIVVYSYHAMLLSNKKEQTNDTHTNMNECQNQDAEWTKPGTKEYT